MTTFDNFFHNLHKYKTHFLFSLKTEKSVLALHTILKDIVATSKNSKVLYKTLATFDVLNSICFFFFVWT